MLLKRIIPCLDVDRGRVVKGTNFVDIRDAGDPVELASRYDREGADEVVFLDITASHEKRDTIVELARHCAEELFIPFTIGGGIRSEEDVRALLGAGADKVSLNSAAIRDPDLISACARRFGSQCVVLAIDAKRVASPPGRAARGPGGSDGGRGGDASGVHWEAYLNGGRVPTGLDAVEWAVRAVGLGAGEILLTSMDRDGTKDGYDLELTRAVAEAVNVPGHRERRRGDPRPPGGGHREGQAPTRSSRRRSSTTASTPSGRPRSTWPRGGSPSDCRGALCA